MLCQQKFINLISAQRALNSSFVHYFLKVSRNIFFNECLAIGNATLIVSEKIRHYFGTDPWFFDEDSPLFWNIKATGDYFPEQQS